MRRNRIWDGLHISVAIFLDRTHEVIRRDINTVELTHMARNGDLEKMSYAELAEDAG